MLALFVFIFTTISSFPLWGAESSTPRVLVSVAPHKFFVEKIAGNTVKVDLMVPAGASAHTFEPTPKQMLNAARAEIWFCLGEAFEAKAIKALKAHHPEMAIVDLRDGVDLIIADPHSGQCCCHKDCQDLHIWLSARQAKIQATTIAQILSKRYPDHAEEYQVNLNAFIKEMEQLDNEIEKLLVDLQGRIILVSHPAYAYFCRDYHLKQLSIEFEGKDPTPYQMNLVLNQARQAHIKKVFAQPQYNSKGARLFACHLNAELVMLDPYSEDYINSMKNIAQQIASSEG